MSKIASHSMPGAPEGGDDERLLTLFWNRAELKKQFASLRREGDDLKERLQHQEGATLKAQQKLEQLEAMLADPLQAANASVFYQLRGVWAKCKRRLTRLSKDLSVHQAERERQAQQKRFQAQLRAGAQIIDGQIAPAQRREDALTEDLRVLHERVARLRGFWNVFKRRALLAESGTLELALQNAQLETERLRASKADKLAEPAPAFTGLSVEGRRKINLALIAIAQEMFLHFGVRKISTLAREASVRCVTEARYGDIQVCRELNMLIAQRIRELPVGDDLVHNVRTRARLLGAQANYRMETDTVPVASSFAEIPVDPAAEVHAHGRKSIPVNILADEYWEIYTFLQT